MRILTDKRGLSPVVATIILCGVVLVLGIATWSLTYTVSINLETSYYEDIKKQIDKISERFTIEHIAYSSTELTLHVWVYNYGDVDIEVIQVVATGDAEGGNNTAIPVTHGKMVKIEISLNAMKGDELSITVMSGRNNFAYATYIVPYT